MSALAPPGSFAWLVGHEMRLAWRARARRSATRWLGYVLAALYIAAGIATAIGLRGTPIEPGLKIDIALATASIASLTFMTTQAILGSQRTLYESGDLDLLLSAPIAPRIVLLAKLISIAATIVVTYAALTLPMVVPIAALGHPRLFGFVALLAALGLTAAALGFAITLALARAAGPRAARTVGQIAAALIGGAVFLVTQLGNLGGRRRSSYQVIYEWMRARHLGGAGWSAWPGRAAFGEPFAMLGLLAIGTMLFVATGVALQRAFLSGYQDAGMRLVRSRPGRRTIAPLFHAGLFRSVFAKEWRLLARDPALMFQIVLRLVYTAPLVLIGLRHEGTISVAPLMAFASVLIVGQLVGSFAWLAISAEDAPELIAVAPIARGEVARAKLAAALAMAAPFALLLPTAMIWQSPLGALVTILATAIGGTLAGLIELKLGKPGQRSTFARRRQGSVVVGILSLVVTIVVGGAAAVVTFVIG